MDHCPSSWIWRFFPTTLENSPKARGTTNNFSRAYLNYNNVHEFGKGKEALCVDGLGVCLGELGVDAITTF